MGAVVKFDDFRARIAQRSAFLTAGLDPGMWVVEQVQTEALVKAIAHFNRARRACEERAPRVGIREIDAAVYAISCLHNETPVAVMMDLIRNLNVRRRRLVARLDGPDNAA